MSKIIFTALEVENYSCIENATIPIDTAKICLIQGEKLIDGEVVDEVNINKDKSNGTGKTSLVEAFYWCITGEFFDPGSTMSTVINRFTKGDAVVRLIGQKDDIPFLIERTLTTKSKRVGAKVTHVIKFVVDGENIHDKTSSLPQIQETINSFLGTNPLLLLNSRIIGQGEISSFTKVNDRQKKILIDNLVGLGICDKYLAASKKLYSETCTSITALDIELNSVQATITRLERDKNNYISKHTEWEDKLADVVTTATTNLHRLNKRLTTITETISVTSAAIGDLNTKAKEHLEDGNKLNQAKEIAEIIKPILLQHQANSIELEKETTYYKRKIEELYKERDELAGNVTMCPYCQRDIDKDTYETLQNILEKKITTNSEAWNKLDIDKAQVDGQLAIFTKLKDKIDSIIDKFTNGLKILDGFERSVGVKKNELYKLQLDKQIIDNEIETQTNIVTQSKEKQESSPFLSMMEDCDKEIAELKEKIKEKTTQLAIYEEEKLYYGLISRAFDKDGIPKLVSTDALGVINSLISRYTNRIFGSKFKLELKIKPRGKSEEIYPEIDNPEGGLTYARQSGGERKDIDLCQQFALREFARMQDKSNFNVEFFDEVFAELDNHTSELFLDLIFEGDTDNIFIITHKDMCKEYFRNKITVQKKGSTSTVHVNYASVNGNSSETLKVAN